MATNWIAPVGPHLEAFEREFAAVVGPEHAVAVSSGTAALHLALILAGNGRDDEVLVSDFTFAASVNQIVYQGATPFLIDSGDVELGQGTIVSAGCVLTTDIRVGAFVTINTRRSLAHNDSVEAYATLAPGCISPATST